MEVQVRQTLCLYRVLQNPRKSGGEKMHLASWETFSFSLSIGGGLLDSVLRDKARRP